MSCSVNLGTSTAPNSLLFIVASATHHRENASALSNDPAGYTRILTRKEDKLTVAVWRREAAPSTTKVTVQASGETFTLQARLIEFTGAAQSGAIDRVAVGGANPESGPGSQFPSSGSTGTTAQADEGLFGVIVNRYASTVQTGFSGGLAKLYETLSSSGEPDHDRTRMTVHAATTTATGSYKLSGLLGSNRDWVAVLISFRGGSLGPARMSSLNQGPAVRVTGRGTLTAFGPLQSRNQSAAIRIIGSGWIGPFEQQFLLGGKQGLLIGAGTPYRVESVEGLGGWDIRSSDADFPRGDGAQRGIDLQSARQVAFRVNFDAPPVELEQRMQALLRVLRPQRDDDWDLIFRLVGSPLQMLRCRPMSLTREMNTEQFIRTMQGFALRAADPRIYSVRTREVVVPVTPAGPDTVVTTVSVINEGNDDAYPTIRIRGAPGVEVTNIQLINATADVRFEVSTVLGENGEIVGDMPAVVTGAPRSKVTLDGNGIYGAWQSPREPFYIAPDPVASGGVNAIYLRTVPAGAPVTCVLEYRDTSSG